MKKIILGLLVSLSLLPAQASQITLGHPGYGGNGCPQGTVSTTLSPDSKALSILFDEFYVEAGGDRRSRKMARKSCNIAIPVHVPQGFSVSIVDIDYRGYVSLPRGAQARLSSEYFIAGQRGPRFVKTFRGGFDDEYLSQDKIGIIGTVWSACGADVNLRVNASMMVRTNRQKEDALATVDSADISSGLVYHLQWKRCNSSANDDFFGF